MTAMEKTDYEKISFGRVPFVWKKKINNLVKESPERAMAIFFYNFRENNESRQMIYGFELLLPHSLVYILNRLDELNTEQFIQLLNVFNNSAFLDSLLEVDLAEQKKFLSKIVQNWEICNESLIKKILSQLNPKLSEESYQALVKTKQQSYVELLILWVECDVRVLYLILQSYIQQPIDLILPLFRKIPKEKLLSACSSQNLPNKLSPKKVEIFLKIFDISDQEINFLLTKFSSASNKAQEHLINWIKIKNLTNSEILKAIPLKLQTQTSTLIITYFSQKTNGEKEKEMAFLAEIIESSLFIIASSVLGFLNQRKDTHALDYLFSLFSYLEKNLDQFANFLIPEFQKYSNNEEQRLIEAYFQTRNENIQEILLPSINTLKPSQWKKLIEHIILQNYFTDRRRVSLLLGSFDEKTISEISKYIIKKKYILQLNYLYENFHFFQPLLTTTAAIESEVYTRLVNYLESHFKTHFEEIVSYSDKISFPKSLISSVFTKNEIWKLVSCVGLEKKLIAAWETVFLLHSKEALPHFLKKFKEKSKKSKEPLLIISKKLIDIEIVTFWKYIASISSKSLPTYATLLNYALDKSVPNLAEIITFLPSSHVSHVVKNIIPDLSTKSTQMLYAILSVQESSILNHTNVNTLILAILKLNPQELVYIVLIRLTKLETNPNLRSFSQNLFNQIISKYPRATVENIDDHNLSSFTLAVGDYIKALPEKKFRILLKYIIPNLKTRCLRPTLVDQCLSRFRRPSADYKLLQAITTTDQSKKFSDEGQSLLSALIKQLIGRSLETDLRILTIVQGAHLSLKESLLIAYFSKLPQDTLDFVLSDPSINISEDSAINALTTRFAKRPPYEPEQYYISLYQQSSRAEIKRAVLPLIGEYCSWKNLPFLMELPERKEFEQEYSISINKFIERFEIDSAETLYRIWSSGLKDIYTSITKTTVAPQQRSNYQSNCPKCNNPILEGQKNCGFCTQRLTCAICFKSVVTANDVDLVECTQCSSYFHRRHLLQSVKIRNECPICDVRLSEREVSSLPQVKFFFN